MREKQKVAQKRTREGRRGGESDNPRGDCKASYGAQLLLTHTSRHFPLHNTPSHSRAQTQTHTHNDTLACIEPLPFTLAQQYAHIVDSGKEWLSLFDCLRSGITQMLLWQLQCCFAEKRGRGHGVQKYEFLFRQWGGY